MKKTIKEMQLARGVGILLVTLGHSEPIKFIYPKLFAFIYSFHMALFFFLAGFFARPLLQINSSRGYFQVVGRKVKFLIVPYLFISVSYVFLKYIFASQVHRPIIVQEVLFDILFFPNKNPALFLWFLYTLIVMILLTPLISKVKWPVVLVCLLVLSLIDVQITVFSLNNFCRYYLYFFVALQLGVREDIFFKFLQKKQLVPWLMVLTLLFYGILAERDFIFGSIIKAFVGVAGVLTFCFSYRYFLPERLVAHLGKHSFEIYLLQYYFIFPVSVICLSYFPPGIVVLLSFTVGLLGPLCLSHWVLPYNYWLSWLFGGAAIRSRRRKTATN